VDEEPNEHLQVDLLAAEGQTFADQVSDTQAQGGVEAFDMLSAPDAVDLLRKSGRARSGEVTKRRDELDPECEPATSMSVYALQHAKYLHAADDVFYPLAAMREHTVLLTLFRREGRRSRRLVGRDGVPVASP